MSCRERSPAQDSPRLRTVDPSEVAAALADSLSGGQPIATLPADPIERARAIAMFQPGSAGSRAGRGSCGRHVRFDRSTKGRGTFSRSDPGVRQRRRTAGSAGLATGRWRCPRTTSQA